MIMALLVKGDEKRQGQYVERTVAKALACAEGRSR